jgi:U3 small nucleolar RNA-associated protein 11
LHRPGSLFFTCHEQSPKSLFDAKLTREMASLRNAIPRKTHKERSQPAARKHLGLLEKKKDYIERARDFQRKTGRITDLRKKATEKNPDEFYFGMIHAKTNRGVHEAKRKDGVDGLSHSEVRVMKDQDLTYLAMKQSVDERRAQKLQNDLHLIGSKPMNCHTIFVDNEAEAASFHPAKYFDTAPELADRAFNRPRMQLIEAAADSSGSGTSNCNNIAKGIMGASNTKQLKKILKKRERSYIELSQRLERADKLKLLMQHKQVEKNVMSSKGSKRKIKDSEGGKPAVYKWKRQRAR